MRKIFIALAASLLITIGSAVRITQKPVILDSDLSSGYLKPQMPRFQKPEYYHEGEHDEQKEFKNAQGILGLVEETVNVGDKVAQIADPAIPSINLSNKGNVVTLKVAGKLAEAETQWNLMGAMKNGIKKALDYQPGKKAKTESDSQ